MVDTKNVIITNKGNFFDLMNMTMQLCSAMEAHSKRQEEYENGDMEISPESLMLTAGEIGLVDNLIRLIRLEVNFYSGLGLSDERQFWGELQVQMKKILPE